jgi:spore coat polysaccharide biosynthesis protein SpsF
MPYIWKHPDRFSLRSFAMQPNLSHWRLTVDKPEDLELMRRIYSRFADEPLVDYLAVIGWLMENPDLLSINAGTIRNEGYVKSLLDERTQ